jgi:uncharacterized protein (UPF0276 family)
MSHPRDPGGDSPRLGVGLIYTIAADSFARQAGALDYWAITPDMFWTDAGPAANPASRFAEMPRWVVALEEAAEHTPIVAHHIGLSLASTIAPDPGYLAQLESWRKRWRYPWLSDHLSFAMVDGPTGAGSAGIALPVPCDEEVLSLVAERVAAVMELTGRPFLVENPAYYIRYGEEEMTDAEFLNRLCDRTGCGLLLDLHNLHCNSTNLGFDAREWLAALDLTKVVEIHIAGGAWIADVWADSHAGPCPEAVWGLLDHVLPHCPNVRGITFEFHDSWFHTLGNDGLGEQISRARDAWAYHVARRAAV